MNVIYISEGNIPSKWANTMQVMKMSQALAKLTSAFELVTLGDLKSLLTGQAFDFWSWYGIQYRFRITRLPLLLSSQYPFPANYRHPAFPKYAVWYSLLRRPHLLYTRAGWAGYWALRLGLNVIFESHELPENITLFSDHVRLVQKPNFVALVTVSDDLASSYVEAGVPVEKIVVLFDAVDLERFEPAMAKGEARRLLGLPGEQAIAVYAGHLYDRRGVEEILACVQMMPEILFLLVGGWEGDVERRKAEVRQRNLGNVHLTGFVLNQHIPTYLAAADVLLMPYSRRVATAKWMSPVKMFEYMAAGRPIIASDLPAIRQVLQHDVNAWLTPPDDGVSLAESIKALLRNEARGQRLAEQARKDVQVYSWDRRAQEILAFAQERMELCHLWPGTA